LAFYEKLNRHINGLAFLAYVGLIAPDLESAWHHTNSRIRQWNISFTDGDFA